MNKKLKFAGVMTLLVYPSFLVLMFVSHLFANRAFTFFGFGLDLTLLENSADIRLYMKPYFFLSFMLIFIISLGLSWVFDVLRNKERVMK